jgi:hypothetical protein
MTEPSRRMTSTIPESRELGLQADSYAGALAIAAGETIGRSAKEGRPYSMKELLGEFYRGPE